MQTDDRDATQEALEQARDILNQSPRILTLKGLPGVWAGGTVLVGVAVAHRLLQIQAGRYIGVQNEASSSYFDPFTNRFIVLAVLVFIIAVSGAMHFTRRKEKAEGKKLWNHASKVLLLQLLFPLLAGGIFSIAFIYYGQAALVPPICLAFYGLALIGAGRHTLSDIRYLGMVELMLGCTNLFFPEHGLFFWGLGFGALNMVYGAVMWNR